jgi:8-oxo-dGTP pyrophosphatase MutT (NUDIX family)
MMHSVAMSVGATKGGESDAAIVQVRTRQPSARFVRLSQLRKLRECGQVAAVCYRVRNTEIEFLLVRTRGSGRWTFPKGSAEPGLTHAQAAALEAFEEAGVHGRMEESPFARYVRRKRGSTGNDASKSDEKEIAVNAHLCEVIRLSPPPEANRNRTWFSVDDARRSLRQGRKRDDAAEFARVIDRAVARIQQHRSGTDIVDQVQNEPQPAQQQGHAQKKDALQKAPFDYAEAYGWVGEASSMPHIGRQLDRTRQSVVLVSGVPRREVLPCEVLEFSPPRQKKARALGTSLRG